MSAGRKEQELDGIVQLHGDTAFPVFAGQVFASITSGQSSFTGQKSAKDKPDTDLQEKKITTADSSCLYKAESGELVAKGYGLVQIVENKVLVKPLMRVSKDRFHILATLYARDFKGQEVTPERIKKAVHDLGLQAMVDINQVQQALEEANKQGQPKSGVIVASGGVLPQEARDASLELAGDIDFPVFPGQVLGRLIQARTCLWGKCIDGTPLQPEHQHEPETIKPFAKCGWELGSDQETIYATRYGLLKIEQRQPRVEPLLKLTSNRLKLWMTLYAYDFYHNKIKLQDITKLLQRLGVACYIDEQAISEALKQAKKSKSPVQDVLAAYGQKPRPGAQGQVVFAQKNKEVEPEKLQDLDPRDYSLYFSVVQDQLICWLQAPESGQAGQDVFGREIPAEQGAFAEVLPGENVQACKDGQVLYGSAQEQQEQEETNPVINDPGTEFRAEAPGIIEWDGKKLSVQEAVQIKGDVDFATGNIDFKKGAVHVQGTIKSGFSVKTPDSVYVRGTIEGALVKCGKNCIVNMGLTMQEKGMITVGGYLQAHFMENATLRVRGDVLVTHDIVNCTLWTLGQVQAVKGRGTIQGGLIRVGSGLQANVLGSEHGTGTRIVLNFSGEGDPDLVQKRDELNAKLQRLQNVLGNDDYYTLLNRFPKEKHSQLIEMIKAKSSINSELKEIKSKIKQSKEMLLQKALQSRIEVRKMVYPGVEISIGNQTLEIKETMKSPVFYLDQETMTIKTA